MCNRRLPLYSGFAPRNRFKGKWRRVESIILHLQFIGITSDNHSNQKFSTWRMSNSSFRYKILLPLIKPCMQFSRTRLSCNLRRKHSQAVNFWQLRWLLSDHNALINANTRYGHNACTSVGSFVYNTYATSYPDNVQSYVYPD
jgi:hypothetical protein